MSTKITVTRTYKAQITQVWEVEVPDDKESFFLPDEDQWICDNGTLVSEKVDSLPDGDDLDLWVSKTKEARYRDLDKGALYQEMGIDEWERAGDEDESELDELGIDPDMVVVVPA